MTNLPNNLDTFQRVSNNTRSENAHTDLHNNLADAVEAIEKYSGSNIVLELPATSEVNRVYTLKQTHQGRRPGIYICTQADPAEYLNVGGVQPKAGGGLRFDGQELEVESTDGSDMDPQAAGYLIGGTGHSALSVFQALGVGANDGKFKINVDGTFYDDTAINLLYIDNSTKIISSSGNVPSITVSERCKITSFLRYLYQYNSQVGVYNINIRADNSEGDILATSENANAGGNGGIAFYFSGANQITLYPGNTYYFEFVLVSGQYVGWLNTNQITGYGFHLVASLNEIAENIQSGIRTTTGSTETVIYDTDHFVITSATQNRDSQILKLMTPSTGTDISGAGAAPYLDMADNATETQGTGEEYKLVRLDENGKINNELIVKIIGTGENQITSGRALNTVYQNTTEKPIFVIASVGQRSAIGSGVVQVYGKIGLTSSPDITVSAYTCGESGSSAEQTIPHSFIVPVGYYYTITTVGGYGGSPVLTTWFECDLI